MEYLPFIIAVWGFLGLGLISSLKPKHFENMNGSMAVLLMFVGGPYIWLIAIVLEAIRRYRIKNPQQP